jgi:dTDP-4-amino-4,6-dideoxygalactose transaminase
LIAALHEADIQSVFHYVPLHSSPQGRRVSAADVTLPVTDDLSARLVRLPCYFGLEEAEQDRIIDEVRGFLQVR